jgi:nitroreductase
MNQILRLNKIKSNDTDHFFADGRTLTIKNMSIKNLIHERTSPRAFSEQTVSLEQLEMLFEAARWAPSSRNEQPWRYMYALKADSDKYGNMLELLSVWNQKWAQTAPVLIAGISKLTFDHRNLPNEHAKYDLGQSVAYLTLQASDLGVHLHQMGGFDHEKANRLFQLPENFQVVVMIALGCKGTLERIPESYHLEELKKQVRLPLSEIASKFS